jgi:hypothetical protein
MTGVGKVDKKVLKAASGPAATGWWGRFSHPGRGAACNAAPQRPGPTLLRRTERGPMGPVSAYDQPPLPAGRRGLVFEAIGNFDIDFERRLRRRPGQA